MHGNAVEDTDMKSYHEDLNDAADDKKNGFQFESAYFI